MDLFIAFLGGFVMCWPLAFLYGFDVGERRRGRR